MIFLVLSFQVSTHMHHVTSVVKDGHLAVVLHLGGGEADPGMQYGAQSCQELKANWCKIEKNLSFSWGLIICQQCR